MTVHQGRAVHGLTLHPVVLAATAAATTLTLRRLLVVSASLSPHAASVGLHAASLTPHAAPRIVRGGIPAVGRQWLMHKQQMDCRPQPLCFVMYVFISLRHHATEGVCSQSSTAA